MVSRSAFGVRLVRVMGIRHQSAPFYFNEKEYEMTKRQRIRWETRMAISKNAVGAARTAELLAIRQKYHPARMSTEAYDQICLFHPYCDVAN